MAQSIFLPRPALHNYCPSSPDPTPLRLLAFSVAEAALQSDPNSPSFNMAIGKMPTPPEMMVSGSDTWPSIVTGNRGGESGWQSFDSWTTKRSERTSGSASTTTTPQRRKPLWDIVERAKERRDKESSPSSTDSSLPQSPPLTPSSYNFILPPNSPLAASIAAHGTETQSQRQHKFSLNTTSSRRVPLYTRSAEPSPVKSTFSGLDQTRPPPEFVPRLSASEFSTRAKKSSASFKHARTKSDAASPAMGSNEKSLSEKLRSQARFPGPPSRHTMRLPSLAQIQAKMSKPHRRGVSVGAVHEPLSKSALMTLPRLNTFVRSDSQESVEVLKTPVDEDPSDPRIVLASILNRRTPSPAPLSPTKEKEARLAPFLRERTNGRLSGARPMSLPPMAISFETIVKANAKPALRVTPPKERVDMPEGNVPSPTKGSFPWLSSGSGFTTPTESRFNLAVASTPPPRSASTSPRRSATSPASPTGSLRSSLTASPTLSVPIITCTPAPQTVFRDGVEHESDEEEDEVVVFDGEAEEAKEREEREKRAEAMKARLMLRRQSD